MYIQRSNENFVFASFERSFVSAVLGPRRVGKSTLVAHYVEQHPQRKWVILNMDRYSERLRVANEQLQDMIEESALTQIGGSQKIWVVIDEAQKCPELFEQIKILYDAFKGKDKIKFVLTGSAHFDLHQLTAESLAGRVDLLNLREFNLKEIAKIQHEQVNFPIVSAFASLFADFDMAQLETTHQILKPFNKLFNAALETHMIWGGFPEVLQEENDNYRWKYIGDYLQTYLEKDIRSIETIADLGTYHNLMKICAKQTGSVREDKKIMDALHCARNTLNKYRYYLLATLQYVEVYPYIDNELKRLVKSPKGYLINNGLISYLTGIRDFPTLEAAGLLGHRFENWFLHELLTWQDTSTQNHQNFFWRTTSGVEVDFVVDSGTKVLPFEVTCSTKVKNDKVRHLLSFMKNEPKAQYGIYLYRGDFKIDEEHKIVFLPAWML